MKLKSFLLFFVIMSTLSGCCAKLEISGYMLPEMADIKRSEGQ